MTAELSRFSVPPPQRDTLLCPLAMSGKPSLARRPLQQLHHPVGLLCLAVSTSQLKENKMDGRGERERERDLRQWENKGCPGRAGIFK